MVSSPALSVVVVSHGRPVALRRCLQALTQMAYEPLEIIVVADQDGLKAVGTLPMSDQFQLLSQDPPNISAARNAGIAAAAGEVVAFVDDDAVPEPSWAAALAAGFAQASLDAATGPVLGRNGISLQWRRVAVDRLGRDRGLRSADSPRRGEAWKLHGTNMAFRRSVFEELGGFDPAFEFFLDDTDMARRVADAGRTVAFLPGAVVHHGFSASERRTQDRVPLTLLDIGASTAVFLRKHAPDADHGTVLHQLEADQRARLLRLVRRRKLGPKEMRSLMETLREGVLLGTSRGFGAPEIPPRPPRFRGLRRDRTPVQHMLGGWATQARALRKKAQGLARAGDVVTLFLFEPTPRKHKMLFTEGGWWEQTGGLFGPAVRTERRLQPWTFARRLEHEKKRVAKVRNPAIKDG